MCNTGCVSYELMKVLLFLSIQDTMYDVELHFNRLKYTVVFLPGKIGEESAIDLIKKAILESYRNTLQF